MSSLGYHLAQLNVARLSAPLDSAQLADFVAGLEPVNAAAEAAPGFVWRLKDDAADNATAFSIYDDPMIIVNMSVWTGHQALWDFVYDDDHRSILRRRREFFEPMKQAFTVLWWVPRAHEPTVAEARERLDHLRANGPSEYAFGLKDSHFTAPIDERATAADARD
jgi:hypothetical protein